jgi:hypothetical protein
MTMRMNHWLKTTLLSGAMLTSVAHAATLPSSVWVGVLTLGPNDDLQTLTEVVHGAPPPEPVVSGFSFRYDDAGVWGTQLTDDGHFFTGRAFVFSSPAVCSVVAYFGGWGDCPNLLGYSLSLPTDKFASALIVPASSLVPEPALPWLALGGLGVCLAAGRRQGARRLAAPCINNRR